MGLFSGSTLWKCPEACVAGKKPAVANQEVHAVVDGMDTVSLQPGLVVGSTCVKVDDIGNIPVQIANFRDRDGDIHAPEDDDRKTQW